MYGKAVLATALVVVAIGALVATRGHASVAGVHESVLSRIHGSGATATEPVVGAAVAGAVQSSGAGGAIEVALRSHGGVMYLPVQTADGTELSFILGMGTEQTLLSESGAKRIGDVNGLTLGGLAVPMQHSQTLADANLTAAGKVFDGLIGATVLNQFDILVDMPGGRLVLKPVGRSVAWEGMALSDPVPLRVFHGFVLGLDVEVNGRRYPAMLELGTSKLLSNESVIAEAAIEGGRADEVRLAGATYKGLPITVSDNPVIERFSPNGDGFVIVGAPVALDCALSISWVHAELRTCVR